MVNIVSIILIGGLSGLRLKIKVRINKLILFINFSFMFL